MYVSMYICGRTCCLQSHFINRDVGDPNADINSPAIYTDANGITKPLCTVCGDIAIAVA